VVIFEVTRGGKLDSTADIIRSVTNTGAADGNFWPAAAICVKAYLDDRGEFIPLKNLAEHLAPSFHQQELERLKISWPRVKCSEASG